MSYTYVLSGPDGVRYVGKTNRPEWRLKQHRRSKSQSYVSRWIRLVGPTNVEMTVTLAFKSEAEAHAAEVRQIAGFRARGYNLTNLTDGGEGASGYRHTPETLARMSAVRKGRTVSPETRAKISAAKMGHTVSNETRAKISRTLKSRS